MVSSIGRIKLEGPQEVGGLLEVRSNSKDLMDQVFHTNDTLGSKILFNDAVAGQSGALSINLSITTLIDQFTDALEIGLTIGNVWLDNLQHLNGGSIQTNKHTIVDLTETEELQNLARLGANLVDTLDTDNKGKLGGIRNIERSLRASNTLQTDLFTFLMKVLLDVLFSTLEGNFITLSVLLGLFSLEGDLGSTSLLNSLTLLEDGLGNGGEDRSKKGISIVCS